MKNDLVIKINNHKVSTSDDLSLYLAMADPKKDTKIVVLRDNEEKTFLVKPTKIGKGKKATYRYGIGLKQEKTKGVGASLVYTCRKTISIFKQMFITIWYLFTGGIHLNQLSGPVGIYSVVGQQRTAGIANILYLMALIQ